MLFGAWPNDSRISAEIINKWKRQTVFGRDEGWEDTWLFRTSNILWAI